MRDDFGVDVAALCDTDRHVLLANPNSPTGIALGRDEVEKIVASRPERLVVLDEAYVDYCGESCVPLVREHRNLIVVHTMSKSRNLAGAHIGYAIAQADLVKDLEDIKFAFNPFNLSTPTMAVGIAAGFGYLLGITLGFGLVGMWFAFVLDENIRGILFVRRWNAFKWANKSFVN